MNRVQAISDPTEPSDPTYVEGLRTAVFIALDYGLAAIEHGEERAPEPPVALLVQARLAARNGVNLDTVLRRYFAGYALLTDFLIDEAQGGDLLSEAVLKRVLRVLATLFDRLLAAVSDEHRREAMSRPSSFEQRQVERVRRLIAGELLDTSMLAYDFDANHLAAVACGPDAAKPLRALASSLDRNLMLVRPEEEIVWAWLGARRSLDPAELERAVGAELSAQMTLALGEPGQGLDGWRLSHRQARAALPIARRSPGAPIRYADAPLLASSLRDDLLATSLQQLYLAPLERERDGGAAARETLRAYFCAGRNVSSAAAALGVKRHTVTNRLRIIEEGLGRRLDSCAAELEVALRLQEIPPVLPPMHRR